MEYSAARSQQKSKIQQANGSHDPLQLRSQRNKSHHVEKNMKQRKVEKKGSINPVNCMNKTSIQRVSGVCAS